MMQILCSSTVSCRIVWPLNNPHLPHCSLQTRQPHKAHLSFHHFRRRKLSKIPSFSCQNTDHSSQKNIWTLDNVHVMQLLLGITAAATGAAGGVAYIGLKGNKHVQWNKICHVYSDFCKHIGGSVVASLFGSAVLALLILLSVRSLSKKIPRHNHSH